MASAQDPSPGLPAQASRTMVRLLSGDFVGIRGRPVEVQVDVTATGSPGFHIVGLAGKSIRESRERIRAAMRNSGFRFPHQHRILVNLAPTAEQKDGAGFDLAVAIGILLAGRKIRPPLQLVGSGGLVAGVGFLGELGLDGTILPVPGALLTAHALKGRGVSRMVVAPDNAPEAVLVDSMTVFAARDLHDAVAAVQGRLAPFCPRGECRRAGRRGAGLDFADIVGQEATKRALLVAAAGGHNVLMTGPPGSGKTMLARRLSGILPALEREEAMEVTRIASAMGQHPIDGLVTRRPFRAPHHTISYAGLVGGGHSIHPGEVTRAHLGVLFLDELPEFSRRALEALREPIESGRITISRGSGSKTFPSRFLLVGAMNPCPCGYLGHPRRPCRCTELQVHAYHRRISGPLLDRMDLFLHVAPVSAADLVLAPSGRSRQPAGATTASLADQVRNAYAAQHLRWNRRCRNADIGLSRLLADGGVLPAALDRLRAVVERLGISARGFARCLRVARTVADIEGSPNVETAHVNEALHYRHDERGCGSVQTRSP